jgi:hypothetical protein
MHSKTPYWFDKNMMAAMEQQASSGGYQAEMGATRAMKTRGNLLFSTSMMQDGWDYFPVSLETDFNEISVLKYVCENDFKRLCREYQMLDVGAMMGGPSAILMMFCPHIKKIKN